MYVLNNVLLQVIRTYSFTGEFKEDKRDGMMCVELRSPSGRYSLITDAETFATLSTAPEDQTNLIGMASLV